MDIENKEFSIEKELKKRYDIIYEETFDTSFTGIHSTILHFAKRMISKDFLALDVGCGAGRLSIIMSDYLGKIDSFDYSKKAIETAKSFAKAAEKENISFNVGDAEKFETEKKYDLIMISEVIEHVDNPEEFIKKYSHLIKKI